MQRDSIATVSSYEDTTIAADSPEEILSMDLDHDTSLLGTCAVDPSKSALKLLQRQDHSSASEHDISWIAEPLQYRKNLGAAFEKAEHNGGHEQNNTSMTMNDNDDDEEPPAPLDSFRQDDDGMLEDRKPSPKSNIDNKFNPMGHLSDPTPSKATVQAKIARFESQSTAANTNNNIAVYLRTRPSSDTSNTIEIEQATSSALSLPRNVRTYAPETSNAAKFGRGQRAASAVVTKEYEFTGVFDANASQELVYERTVRPLLSGLVQQGQSALVFCYGITNAGKTYTVTGDMSGDGSNRADQRKWGLVPRAVRDLWQMTTASSSTTSKRQVQLSYFEVYNEQQYDLLKGVSNNKRKQHHDHLWLSNGSTNNEISRYTIKSLEDGLHQIALAQQHRRSGANGINSNSSRSHSICQLTLVGAEGGADDNSSRSSSPASLWLVDLAGSERAKRITAGLHRHKEAVQINKSLMTLNRCLMALRNNNSHHQQQHKPPYRESKLTQLFGQHWTSPHAGRTIMMVNVNPAACDFDETQHALAYASAAKTVVVGGSGSSDNSSSVTVEYGYDGRRKRAPQQNTSVTGQCIKTIKAVVKKLSPKKKNQYTSKRVQMEQKEQPAVKRARIITSDVNTNNQEANNLRQKLTQAQSETAHWKRDYEQLSEQVRTVEKKVREEVLDEVDCRLRAMKLQCSTEAKSEGSNGNDAVTELLETVAECEDEMKRMSSEHASELSRCKSKYERMLRDKNIELHQKEAHLHKTEKRLADLELQIAKHSSNSHQDTQANAELDHQLAALQQELKQALATKTQELNEKDKCIESLKGQVKHLQQQLDARSHQGEAQKASLCNQIEQLVAELEEARAEVDASRRKQQQTLQLSLENNNRSSRRHQIKYQEVVGMPPPNRDNKKCVLGNIGLNRQDSGDSDSTFGPSKWLKPRQQIHQDPMTGKYSRPRGRAPAGTSSWDEDRGEWRMLDNNDGTF